MNPIIAPPLVCGSFSDGSSTELLNACDTVDRFREALRGEITGCNICFDLGVMVVREPRLLTLVFETLESGRVSSVDISEALHDIGRSVVYMKNGKRIIRSCLYFDPETLEEFGSDDGDGENRGRYSLVRLEQRYLKIDRTEQKTNGWRLRYGELANIPIEQWPADAVEYPKADALNTWRVHEAQRDHNNRQARPEEMRAAWARFLQRAWGIRTNAARVADLKAAVTKLHDDAIAKFTASGIYRGPGQINPKSKTGRPFPPSQYGTRNTALLKDMVTRAYRGNPPATESGAVSTDRDTLLESGDPLLEEFAETGENEKLYTTYLELLEVGTRRPIHPEYNLVVTGRPSAARPNLYNLPRDTRIRECVEPRPGFLFADCDYSAIEFCTLAQECYELFGFSAMRDELIAGHDPHVLFAANLAGVPYDIMLARYEAKDPLAKGLRQLGKAWNYGKGGGMGVPKMVHTSRKQGVRFCVVAGEDTECRGERVTEYNGRPIKPTCVNCLRVGERADAGYFSVWPEMREYFALVSRETSGPAGGTIKGYGFSRAGCTFCNGANFRFQHRASRGQNRALWRLARECYVDRRSPLFGSRPVVTPYDQSLVEVPEDRAPAAAEQLSRIMLEEMSAVCPDVPIRAEPVLTRRWLKDAKPTRVNGVLTVTEHA